MAAAADLYEAALAGGAPGWPDLYIVLEAGEEQLRARRAGDAGRRRRDFDRHPRLVEPLKRHFAALATVLPERVPRLDTSDRESLADLVSQGIADLPAGRPEPLSVLAHMAGWLRCELVRALRDRHRQPRSETASAH